MSESEDRQRILESEIERRLSERFAALRDEFDRLRLESDQRWAGFLSRFDQDFRGLVPLELLAVPSPPPPAAPSSIPGVLPVDAARALDAAENQVDVLHRFLDLCRRYASRVVLIISRGGALSVWKAAGFGPGGSGDDAIRGMALPVPPGGFLSHVLEGNSLRLAKGNEISTLFGSWDATQAVLVPMVVKEKISGALYADCAEEETDRFDADAIGFLTYLAGLMIDRLASRKLKPAPALRGLGEVVAEVAAPPEARPAARESFGTQMMSAAVPAEPPDAPSPPPRFYEEPAEPQEAVGEPPPPPLSEHEEIAPSATMRIPLEQIEGPVPEAARPPDFAPPPSTARPSAAVRRLAGPLAPADGDERREEARRFAKLLISEIKLYNEKAVQEGKTKGNLYERLKEDIDRSRQMYDERIPEDVRANSNFFYEELVRILADGHAEALGI